MDELTRVSPVLEESEDEKIRESLLEYLHTLPNHYSHSGVCAPEWIAWLEKQGEQKPAWSEEDDNCLSIIIAEFSKCVGKSVSKDKWMHCNDFLNSLKDRIQPKVEWNEEDEDMLYKTISVINRLCAEGKEYVWSINTLKKLFYWLKSLKNKYIWKPSDEQMWALSALANNPSQVSETCKNTCKDLLEQLKKLTE